MPTVDRWLLPDGIEEVLPDEAARIEAGMTDRKVAWCRSEKAQKIGLGRNAPPATGPMFQDRAFRLRPGRTAATDSPPSCCC